MPYRRCCTDCIQLPLHVLQASNIPLQAVHLVGPSCCVGSQVSIFRVARCKTSDPVGAGLIRSAAGSGIRGITAGGAEHAVKLSAGSSQASFRSLARQDGTTVLSIGTVSFLLPAAFDRGLALFNLDLFIGGTVGVLFSAVPADAGEERNKRSSSRKGND